MLSLQVNPKISSVYWELMRSQVSYQAKVSGAYLQVSVVMALSKTTHEHEHDKTTG